MKEGEHEGRKERERERERKKKGSHSFLSRALAVLLLLLQLHSLDNKRRTSLCSVCAGALTEMDVFIAAKLAEGQSIFFLLSQKQKDERNLLLLLHSFPPFCLSSISVPENHDNSFERNRSSNHRREKKTGTLLFQQMKRNQSMEKREMAGLARRSRGRLKSVEKSRRRLLLKSKCTSIKGRITGSDRSASFSFSPYCELRGERARHNINNRSRGWRRDLDASLPL